MEDKINGFILFLRAITQSEILTALSKICTNITDSISYDNNLYAKHVACPYIVEKMAG